MAGNEDTPKDVEFKLRILEDRLHSFVTLFVIEIEATLTFHHKFLFGDLKPACHLEKILEEVVGTPAKKIKIAGIESLSKKVEDSPFEFNGIESYNYLDIVYNFNTYKTQGREFFVKIAIDVFQSFEFQFLKIEGYRKDIRNLAIDAVYRFLNYFKDDSVSTSELPKKRLEVRNVVFGKSKREYVPEMATLKTGFTYLPSIPYVRRKKPGYKIKSNYGLWHTASIYEKPGVVEIDGDIKKYHERKLSDCAKYYYRKPFNEENFRNDYNLTSDIGENKKNLRYYRSQDYYDDQFETTLREINEEDIVKRIMELINEAFKKLENDLFVKSENKNHYNEIKLLLKKEYEKIKATLKPKRRTYLSIAEQFAGKKLCDLMLEEEPIVPTKNKLKFGVLNHVKFFCGRKEQLKNIHKTFTDNESTSVSQAVCIWGVNGIGKSDLAIKYANNQSDHYLNTIFINAEKRETVDKYFRCLATQLGIRIIDEIDNVEIEISKQAVDLKVIVQNVYEHLKDKGNSLIILDNVENYAVIEDVIFRGTGGNISTLITTCNQDWDLKYKRDIRMIRLEGLTEDEAVKFVNNSLKDESVDEVKAFVKVLDRLPLVLGHAIAYIKLRRKNIDKRGPQEFIIKDYKELYFKEENSLNLGMNDSLCEYSKKVAITLNIAFKKIKEDPEQGKLALNIFNIIAYLSPENIPADDLFSDLETDTKKLRQAIELLHVYSLIDYGQGIVRVHRLIQQYTRNRLKAEAEEEKVLGEALALLNGYDYIDSIMSVWKYARKYSQLIDDHYFKSDYGESKSSAIHLFAGYRNDCDEISDILKYSNSVIDVNCRNKFGETPLYIAAKCGYIDVVKFLVNKGTLLKNVYYSSAIHVAASNGHKDVVQFLYGMKNTLPKYWINLEPVDEAAMNGYEDIVKILKPTDNETHIYFARLVSGMNQGSCEKCTEIVTEGCEINQEFLQVRMGPREDTIVHIAAARGDVKIIEILFNCDADINVSNKFNERPVHYAAKGGCVDALNFFLDKGVVATSVSLYKENLFHYAALSCRVDVLKMIVSKGLNCKHFDEFERSPLDRAASRDNMNAVKFFIQKGFAVDTLNAFKETALHYVSERYVSKKTIKSLVELKADPNSVDEDGRTPLHKASSADRYDNVMALLEAGADIKICDGNGQSVLHAAAAENNLKIVKLLLKKGADPNVLDCDGDSPLHSAVRERGKLPVVELLHRHGCDIQAVNKLNKTVLEIATRQRKKQIVNYLIVKVDNNGNEQLFDLFYNC
ncbi:uncharacterized protein LOC143910014 [Arctopsyche grandis]|uniref:uncharacterized protein LOC143910014 n=1 Tax=Arctopsyche grandis TaxID=121162 RepID=UPI00406D7CC6